MKTAWKPIIEFRVDGEPKGQPRPRAFARKMGAKFVARVYDAGTAEGWKSCIAMAARQHLPAKPLTGPLRVDMQFIMPRPKSHYRTGKRAGELRPDAPHFHVNKFDIDNLFKAAADALTQIGMWRDDAQVCASEMVKTYGDQPGAIITVSVLADEQQIRAHTA